MFFKVNEPYILQVCLFGPGYYCLLYWVPVYAMTYYVISWPKLSDDCSLQIFVRLTTCYQ